jgi:hypothetical protein
MRATLPTLGAIPVKVSIFKEYEPAAKFESEVSRPEPAPEAAPMNTTAPPLILSVVCMGPLPRSVTLFTKYKAMLEFML